MTNKEAIARIKDHKIIHKMNEPRAIYISEALDMAIKALEKQKAIAELQPPTDNWENYADWLYDLAYLRGYANGLIAKGTQNNV